MGTVNSKMIQSSYRFNAQCVSFKNLFYCLWLISIHLHNFSAVTCMMYICHNHHCQNSPFWAIAFLKRLYQIASGFYFLDFVTIIFLQIKVVSLASIPQTGGPGPCIYVPQWQCDPVITPGTRFPFDCLLWFAGLHWRYSNPPPHREHSPSCG
jgi:hypothetical protein